jgi:dienelactone hydrolase
MRGEIENLGKRVPTVDDGPSQVYAGVIDSPNRTPRNTTMTLKSGAVFLAISTLLLAAWFNPCARADDKDPTRVLDGAPKDSRLGPPKDLNGYFPMKVPASKEAWEKRRKELREQVLVALGLWPMPEKTALHPVIHGKIDRDDYTIEKVFFASYPGHYVSGNLYRPKQSGGRKPPEVRHPAVLSPHGHWQNGRFFERSDKEAQEQINKGAEKTMEGARYPLQARCAQLARMGCVVFHYDMVGNADSQQIPHRQGFLDAEAELRLQSFMGLQTWNSIRALDFLSNLPDVDPTRIGVTGASGGGTQTFILCAVDDRPAAAFPAVMVSTAMQGGCICENCSYLRQDTGNIELAALFAPKPLGMSGADDWTKEIETKGLPELKALYKLYGAEDKVMAKCFPQFEHNYNQVSRELMYNWFNKHLQLGQLEPVVEKPFVPVPPKELSAYDEQHPRPKDATDANGLRKYLKEASEEHLKQLHPTDSSHLKDLKLETETALKVMVNDAWPIRGNVSASSVIDNDSKVRIGTFAITRLANGEQVHGALVTEQREIKGTVVLWVHPAGKASLFNNGEPTPAAKKLLDKQVSILAPDLFMTRDSDGKLPKVNSQFAGYTFGYNRPVVANRVHDVLTAIAGARVISNKIETIHAIAFDSAGPWVLLARGLCGNTVSRTAVDANQFDFDQVNETSDEMMLPGALKYGGIASFAALCAPGELFIHNIHVSPRIDWIKDAYQAAGAADKLKFQNEKVEDEKTIEWLLR